MIFGPSLLLLKRRNYEDFEMSQLKEFLKLYRDAQKLFKDN